MSAESIAGGLQVLAAGVEGFQSGREGRQAAQIKQAEGKAKLAQLERQEETSSVQLQIDALNAKNKELMIQNTRTNTYRALDAYSADGDVRHLNNVKNTDPMMKERFTGVVSFSKIDPVNDLNLINQSDRVPEGIFDDPETAAKAANRFIKLIKADGTSEVLDMMNVYAGTGYTKQLNDQKLKDLLINYKITKAAGGTQKDTAMVRNAQAVAAAKSRIEKAEAEGKEPSTSDKEIVAFGATKKAGVTAGKISAADETTEALVKDFGGRKQFFKTSFDRSTEEGNENYLDAYGKIAAIERLEGVDLSAAQKTQLNDIRSLIAMGDPARGLTDEETGIYDSTLHKVKKYVSDEVSGTAATSSYAAFRNTVRHALFGSALTPAEIASFKEAFGGLGQKLGPVLQQFKTALTQVKAQLGSIASMQNPYSAHVRLGIDEERMDRILTAIDTRIEALDDFAEPEVEKVELKGSFGGRR